MLLGRGMLLWFQHWVRVEGRGARLLALSASLPILNGIFKETQKNEVSHCTGVESADLGSFLQKGNVSFPCLAVKPEDCKLGSSRGSPTEPHTADSFPLPLSDNVPQLIPEPGTPLHSRVLQYRELLDSLPMDAYTHGCILHPELTTDSMIPKYATAEIRSKSPLGQGAGGTAPRPFLQARQGKWQSRAAGELQVPWGGFLALGCPPSPLFQGFSQGTGCLAASLPSSAVTTLSASSCSSFWGVPFLLPLFPPVTPRVQVGEQSEVELQRVDELAAASTQPPSTHETLMMLNITQQLGSLLESPPPEK